MSKLSEHELGLTTIGEDICAKLGYCLLRSKCLASKCFLLASKASSFLRGARDEWREARRSESSALMVSTLSRKEFSYLFSRESPDLLKSPAATITLIASQTLLLMFLLSLDSLEKLSISTRLMYEYFSLRFRSNSLASFPEMNLRPFTSSASSLSSSNPPLARPLSSPTTAPSSPVSGGRCHYSSPFIYQFIRLAPLMQNFTDLSPHLDGSSICLASTPTLLASIGSDDILFQFNSMSREESSSSLSNPNREEVTVFAIHPTHPNSFAIGTKAGVIKYLRPVHQMHLQRAEILYKGDKPIKHISFSHDGKLLGLANDEQQAYVYSIKEKRLFTLSQTHQGGAARVNFGGRSFIYSIGLEGNLILYSYSHTCNRNDESQSDDLFSTPSSNFQTVLLDKYRISSDSLMRNYPFCKAGYAEFSGESLQKVILCPGQVFLQVIILGVSSSSYRFDKAIKQTEEILMAEVVGSGLNHTLRTIATSTPRRISIWNYASKERMHSFETKALGDGDITSLLRISTADGPTFAFVLSELSSSGKIHYYHNIEGLNRLQEQMAIEGEEEEVRQPIVRRDQFNIEKFITTGIHFPLEKYFEEYENAQFLFYNNIGCVIQRIQGEDSFLELQIHDRSRTKRMHLEAKNRPFSMFALRQQIFVYASANLLVFQAESQLRAGLQGWEFRGKDIQAISIGGNWIGVCCKNQIRILDFGGSELHSICFDRSLVAFEAYEDLMVVVYNSAPAMWGCKILEAKIYKVSMEGVKLEKKVPVPLSPNSFLKWFGFSEEGMLICQDTMERISCFRWDNEEWQTVHTLEKTKDRFYIQHISGCDLYGFKLEQPQGQAKNQPKVLPRSLPRRYPMDPPIMVPSFLTKEESIQLSRLLLKNTQIAHEEFRHRRWFKYKYSRNKDHPCYLQSRTILSSQEIKTMKSLLDLQLVELLRKYVGRVEGQMSTEGEGRALMSIVTRQAHFQESKEAARKLLGVGLGRNKLDHQQYEAVYIKKNPPCITKLNQISILEKISAIMSS